MGKGLTRASFKRRKRAVRGMGKPLRVRFYCGVFCIFAGILLIFISIITGKM